MERQLAISRFYREEFLLQLEYLQAAGVLDETNLEVADRARRALTSRLDELSACESFPAVVERLLQRFSALSGLPPCSHRQLH